MIVFKFVEPESEPSSSSSKPEAGKNPFSDHEICFHFQFYFGTNNNNNFIL